MYFIKEHQFITINENEIIIINLINGLADIINPNIKIKLLNDDFKNIDKNIISKLIERNYIFNNKDEFETFENQFTNTINNLENLDAPNYVFIPTYNCNLNCTYCYQKSYEIKNKETLSKEIIDNFFSSIDKINKEKEKKYNIKYNTKDILITLMGGEPLLFENKELISYLFLKIKEKGFRISIITNGTNIEKYINDIVRFKVDSVQVTLDGDLNIHDKRRIFPNGEGSFNKVMKGIELLVSNNIKVDVRINLDEVNINNMPILAKILSKVNRKLCFPYIYLLQHEGCMEYTNVINPVEAIKTIYQLNEIYPDMNNIDISFNGKDFINGIFNDNSFHPSLRKCASSKDQYIFDHLGNIYKCWWGIGKEDYKIGTYLNKLNILNKNNEWKARTIKNISQCKKCNYRFICSGGCVGRNINTNNITTSKGECFDFKNIFDFVIKKEYLKSFQ